MKLGIVVVYLVSDGNEKLLDLHLEYIRRNTDVPYVIYGAAERLRSDLRHRLEEATDVTICELPGTNHRRKHEHAFYLEQLIRRAVEDGSTHIVTLHVDSFPVKTEWARQLARRLGPSTPFVTINGAFTSCLFFSKAFYREQRPTLLLPDEELDSEEYRAFSESFPHIPHSGVGYLFLAHRLGLTPVFLPTTNNRVFGDLVFHFGGTVLKDVVAFPNGDRSSSPGWGDRFRRIGRRARKFVPAVLEQRMMAAGLRKYIRKSEMQMLLERPEVYFRNLAKS